MSGSSEPVFADRKLARLLEAAEAESNRSFVEARARVSPEVGAAWIEVAGAYALFDGPSSPLTQTFGLGMFQPLSEGDFEKIEGFFRQREAPVFHEVSPLADPSALELLNRRGYQPIEFSSVLFRPISPDLRLGSRSSTSSTTESNATQGATSPPSGLHVRLTESSEADLWARTAAEGWSEYEGLSEVMLEVGAVNAARDDTHCFLAESEGSPIAAGALSLHGQVALLAGASTIPSARRRGAQLALLEARLRFAARRGCTLAMMCAQPGSPSQRNAQRHNFQIAYTRIKWQL
ncbi:MAG TPA: GNAT family N-acetyltransferase, partial [Acidobacteriota bacterium]|nr:GNAT family N-acetyltransferase [Acidobacteriota bacterium]